MRAFPNITVVDVAAVVRQLQDSFDRVARAVQLLFGLTMIAGLAVLYAALSASADERRRELAVMRALGGRGKQLRGALLAEFAMLGAIAGTLAGVGAGAIGWLLARFVFHLPYLPGPGLVAIGMLAGAIGVAAAGWRATRTILRAPRHPYTLGLLDSVPSRNSPGVDLPQIPGSTPSLLSLPPGCAFAPRCEAATPECLGAVPPAQAMGAGRMVRCIKVAGN